MTLNAGHLFNKPEKTNQLYLQSNIQKTNEMLGKYLQSIL